MGECISCACRKYTGTYVEGMHYCKSAEFFLFASMSRQKIMYFFFFLIIPDLFEFI